MRISIVYLNLVGQDAIGGCILNQVRYHRRRGDDVRVYTQHPPEGVPSEVQDLVRVVSPGDLMGQRDPHFARSDLYVYHYPGRYPLVESIKGLERGAVLFYFHNVTPLDLWRSDVDREMLIGGRAGIAELAAYADLVVTPSPFNAEQLVEEHGLEPDRIRVLPLAVALDRFHPGPRDIALVERYALEGRRVILFVGRMAGNKRIDLLVESLARVQQRVPRAMLLLVGDESSNAALRETAATARARAAELGVADDVVFTGRVDDLPAHYRLADVYASASLHEGFGVPLIEAMASGVPVVASRATAHPWVLSEAGLLAEPGDADDLAEKLTQVLTDDALCGELVRRGLARSREFSLERYEAGWAEIVADAMARLPGQAYPRELSLPARPVTDGSPAPQPPGDPTIHERLLGAELEQLEASADVMLRGYRVRSRVPLLGGLIAWARRNLTSHLREPYVDPTFERQVAFNREVARLLRQVTGQVSRQVEAGRARVEVALQGQTDLAERLERIEAWLSLIGAELALARSGAVDRADEGLEQRLLAQFERLQAHLARARKKAIRDAHTRPIERESK